MEAVEEPPLLNTPVDGVKITVVCDENDENAVATVASDVCHKSNGVADSESAEVAPVESNTAPNEESKYEIEITTDVKNEAQECIEEPAVSSSSNIDNTTIEQNKESPINELSSTIVEPSKHQEAEIEINACAKETVMETAAVEMDTITEPLVERVTFQTEILVETNDNELIETVTYVTPVDDPDSNNLLSEIYSGQSIELSEALRSSDVTDNVENNNCAARQEVFNKEELLDILEGNNEEPAETLLPTNIHNRCSKKILETQLALQQLSRLKTKSKKRSFTDRLPKSRKSDKKVINQKDLLLGQSEPSEPTVVKKEENIVNSLVKEWDDEEASEVGKSNTLLEETEKLLNSTSDVMKPQAVDTNEKEEEVSVRTSVDSLTEGKTPVSNKTSDEGQPQRRLGRVIKKKVIFDPDNPDTFTKSKIINKSKEPSLEKDQTPLKKIKTEQTFQRSKSKSPMSKLQWKKPSPKTCKQNKRLTEVDKLLMDEGAVNMIYQLTPEAPKGKKNMKTKAEFIKKIQSSTPDSKEMKFRERKKESKYEEGEARKILGGKHRSSLSSSVKSPSACEDFEAHSADDSIIYRRHSSSSYSSSCMSPRRLSDVEVSNQSVTHSRNVGQGEIQNQSSTENVTNCPITEVFMSESTDAIRSDTINKNDCMSIKEKLNSKLNLALNKRKRDNSKPDKPSKLKKVIKSDEKPVITEDFKYLSISFDQRLAEIQVNKIGFKCNIQILKELEKALQVIDLRKDISVTLLSSECGTTFSDLDLRALLDDNIDATTNFAYEMAESIRSLLHTVEQHSKLLCSGMNGRCSGVGLALIGLSDVALASERTSFAISPKSHAVAAPVGPGVSVFTTYRLLPQPLLNDLIVFGRRLSASEALHGGLITRTLWAENFNEQVQTIAKDIAAQPAQNVWLKKQLLSMKKHGAESTFLSYLKKERDLLVEYWTSVEGQEIVRGLYNAA